MDPKYYAFFVGPCKTIGGNQCLFPFKAGNLNHRECVWDENGAWCTLANIGGRENCDPSCPISSLDESKHILRQG